MPESTETDEAITAAVEPLRADPEAAAILLDLDGTLAPIVSRPEDAAISERAREALRAIAARFGVAAFVTGRPALVARGIAGLGEFAYAGNHGFEVLAPGGGEEPVPAEVVRAYARVAAEFTSAQGLEELEQAGVRVEDKGPIVALHWRGAPDPGAAEVRVAAFAAAAEDSGLVTHRGRMVLELRPPVRIDKGVAVRELLARSGLSAALFAGDDRTDLDAFAALEDLRAEGELTTIVRVGVRSAEGPAEIVKRADLVLEDTDAVTSLLEALAG